MSDCAPSHSTSEVRLRDVVVDDLPVLFDQQLNPAANHMAAFTSEDPSDREAFTAHWSRILADEGVTTKTILWGTRVAGYIAQFERLDKPEVSYWIGRDYWGRGIATRALSAFLEHITIRPLFARIAKDNAASLRVLEKCGFAIAGQDKGFSNARGVEVEEFILEVGGNQGEEGTSPAPIGGA